MKSFSICIFLTIVVLSGCTVAIDKQQNEASPLPDSVLESTDSSPSDNRNDTATPKYIDADYKLFFGEWKIEKIIASGRGGPDENAEELIDRTLKYDYNLFCNDSSIISEEPYYRIGLLPTDIPPYIRFFPTFKELGIAGPYVAIVTVKVDDLDSFGGYFFVKDDSTILLVERNAIYEVNRTAYLPTAEISYRRT